jgi:hypothetical protein
MKKTGVETGVAGARKKCLERKIAVRQIPCQNWKIAARQILPSQDWKTAAKKKFLEWKTPCQNWKTAARKSLPKNLKKWISNIFC